MVTYSIEELHELLKNKKIDIHEYYEELMKEAEVQQERLNAFVTITKDEAMKNLDEFDENDLLSGIPYVLKDNYNTKGIKTFQSVILAGVTDVKHLKGKIRSEDAHKENSPWNIAAMYAVLLVVHQEEVLP